MVLSPNWTVSEHSKAQSQNHMKLNDYNTVLFHHFVSRCETFIVQLACVSGLHGDLHSHKPDMLASALDPTWELVFQSLTFLPTAQLTEAQWISRIILRRLRAHRKPSSISSPHDPVNTCTGTLFSLLEHPVPDVAPDIQHTSKETSEHKGTIIFF